MSDYKKYYYTRFKKSNKVLFLFGSETLPRILRMNINQKFYISEDLINARKILPNSIILGNSEFGYLTFYHTENPFVIAYSFIAYICVPFKFKDINKMPLIYLYVIKYGENLISYTPPFNIQFKKYDILSHIIVKASTNFYYKNPLDMSDAQTRNVFKSIGTMIKDINNIKNYHFGNKINYELTKSNFDIEKAITHYNYPVM